MSVPRANPASHDLSCGGLHVARGHSLSFRHANDLANKGDYEQAILDYNKAIELSPRMSGAYTGRGLAWYYKGDLDKAAADYSRAIEINPKSGAAYHNRAIVLDTEGDSRKAIDDYNRAIEFEPKCEHIC